MNNTALFDYYYSRRPATARAATRDPAGLTHWENLPSFREACRAQRAMRALMADSHSVEPHAHVHALPVARPVVR